VNHFDAEARAERIHLQLMLALTFSTGVVDAVGYLGMDRVFTGNMTGNVVVLGMALTGADGLPVLGPALALLGFLAGAALGGRALRRAGSAWTGHTTALFGVVAAVVLGVAVLATASDDHAVLVTSTTLVAVAMGIQAATARFIAIKDVTTVVVTSTLTGLAADSVFGNGKVTHTWRRALAVALILAGAAVGALALQVSLGAGLLVAGLVIGAVTVVGARHPDARPAPVTALAGADATGAGA
jgi:uncharacterized membrane protein YoaK (UPF0700 family)